MKNSNLFAVKETEKKLLLFKKGWCEGIVIKFNY